MIDSSFLGARRNVKVLLFFAAAAVFLAVVCSLVLSSVSQARVVSVTDISTRAQAEARANNICANGAYFGSTLEYPPGAFGAYPSNINFNTNTGAITYDINIVFRGCPNVPDYSNSYAFAVTGYPAGGLAICPNVGTYYSPTGTYDCLKYVDTTYPNSQHAKLECLQGEGAVCVNSSFFGLGVGIRQARPGGGFQQLTITGRSGQVPNWSTRTLTSGTYSFGGDGALCGYWHIAFFTGPGNGGRMCQRFRINVAWDRFSYQLTPTINSIPDIIEHADSNIAVSGAISHIPSSSTNSHSNIQWRLTRTVFAPGSTINTAAIDGSTPCNNARVSGGDCDTLKSGNTGSGVVARGAPYTSGISDMAENSDWAAGTRVCFQLSVSRYGSASSQTGWRHSELRCAVVGKKPKVQIHGGSLQVGRAFNGAGLSDSRVEGSLTTLRSPTRLYGSWVEYGIFASGQVINIASGSGLNNGSPQSLQSRWSCLTFANAPTINSANASCNNPGPYGSYVMQNAGLPDVAAQYPVGSTTPVLSSINLSSTPKNRVVTTSGTLNMTGGQLNSGEWLVVNAGDRTVNITGDLRYNDSASLSSSEDIPQLIIIARDINISGSVERVDAWLVATGSLVTCSDRGTASQLRSVSNPANLPNGYRLTTEQCNRQLTVNGPVIADTAWLRRTHGASSTVSDAGIPAEIFNLRPDAYLWAANRVQPSVYRTTSVSERPPRY